MSKLYQIEFDELFENERQAVVCYLSLERRYLRLCKHFREETGIGMPPPNKEVANVCAKCGFRLHSFKEFEQCINFYCGVKYPHNAEL